MNSDLEKNGFIITDYPLPDFIKSALLSQDFSTIDEFFKNELKPLGNFFKFLTQYLPVNFIEHIIAIRSAPEDEEGIWHDDGSRLFGFSLSLNLNPDQIAGGNLNFKAKNSEILNTFPPQPYGRIILFLTGQYGYEHQVTAVTHGQRVVIAGWGSNDGPLS